MAYQEEVIRNCAAVTGCMYGLLLVVILSCIIAILFLWLCIVLIFVISRISSAGLLYADRYLFISGRQHISYFYFALIRHNSDMISFER